MVLLRMKNEREASRYFMVLSLYSAAHAICQKQAEEYIGYFRHYLAEMRELDNRIQLLTNCPF